VALRPAPRALPAALAGGALCALWSAFQGLVTQTIYYGARVIDLYLALLARAGQWLGIPPAAGWWGLLALVGVVALMGATGGWLGRRVGADSRARLEGAG